MTDDRAALDGFTGVARLFPLPNLVLFPHVDQGLHIFEPRYRQMTADALATDQLIALVLLRPGWETDYDSRPAIESVACLGRVTHSERLPDGRYNLRLRGLARFQIAAEVPDANKLYRLARGTILADVAPADIPVLKQLRCELRQAVLSRFDPAGQTHKQVTALFDSDMRLCQLCDLLSYSLPLSLDLKMQLLGETDVPRRVRLLADALGGPAPTNRQFPPVFSPN
jgi:uncharacterized protein